MTHSSCLNWSVKLLTQASPCRLYVNAGVCALIEIQYPSRQQGLLAFSPSSSSSSSSSSALPLLTALVCPPTLPKWVFNLKVSALTFSNTGPDKAPLANKWINGDINNALSPLHAHTHTHIYTGAHAQTHTHTHTHTERSINSGIEASLEVCVWLSVMVDLFVLCKRR